MAFRHTSLADVHLQVSYWFSVLRRYCLKQDRAGHKSQMDTGPLPPQIRTVRNRLPTL